MGERTRIIFGMSMQDIKQINAIAVEKLRIVLTGWGGKPGWCNGPNRPQCPSF
jgi:hypothetical protein